MENYWPWAYSFKLELKILLEIIKQQIDTVLAKIEKADAMTR